MKFFLKGGLNQEMLASAQNVQHHVRALYTHSGIGDTQLSFVTGDVIMLIGEARGGWQYGENTRTHRYYYFSLMLSLSLSFSLHNSVVKFFKHKKYDANTECTTLYYIIYLYTGMYLQV